MIENVIAKDVVNACYEIHKGIGAGLFESIYEELLFDILAGMGYEVKRQYAVPVKFNGKEYNMGFRADLIVNDTVLIELKSIEQLHPIHFKQTLTYIKLLDFKLGLLINFNVANIGTGIKRIANNL